MGIEEMFQNVFSVVPKFVPPLSPIPLGGEPMNLLLGMVSIAGVTGGTRVRMAVLTAQLKFQLAACPEVIRLLETLSMFESDQVQT